VPLHTSFITAGAGSSIPITGGAATSGPIATDINFAPIRIGGVFSNTGDAPVGSNLLPILSIAAVAVLALFMFGRRR